MSEAKRIAADPVSTTARGLRRASNGARHNTRLLIVYNADGGLMSAIKDWFHKYLSPSTYPCSLCGITYGPLTMWPKWRHFLDSLRMEVIFHHRDDFADAFPDHGITLPAILVRENGYDPEVLVPAERLDTTANVDELIEIVEEALVEERLRGTRQRA